MSLEEADDSLKRNVWILNHYASVMFFDEGGRHYAFAKYLKKDGYNPVVFCSNTKHNEEGTYYDNNVLFSVRKEENIGVPFVFVKGFSYKENKGDRIINFMRFFNNVKRAAKIYAEKHGKPDLIYASSVHPLSLIAGIQLAKKFNVKCICEIRDLWPESLVAYGVLKKKSLLTRALYHGERWIYKKADSLIFTMEGGADYVQEKGWAKVVSLSKIYHINNGVDLDAYDSNRSNCRFVDRDLENKSIFKAVYVGSIRTVNELDTLLNVAKQIKDPEIEIFVWGDGDSIEKLENRIKNEHIENIVFKGRVEKKYIPSLLSQADVCLMHSKTTVIAKYGMSLNKSFEYLASGKPIITTVTGKYDYITGNGAGFFVEHNSTKQYADLILKMKNMPEDEYHEICEKAFNTAKKYDFKILTKKLEMVIEQL